MKSAVSFVRAFFGTCFGISIFVDLRFQSWLRTLWHLLLMGVFCAWLITMGENYRIRPAIQAGVNIFKSTFGGKVSCKNSGFVPEKSPSVSRFIGLPNNGGLWYLANGRLKSTIPVLEKNTYLVLWAPKGFATCVQQAPGKWQVSVIKPGKDGVELSGKRDLTSAQLLEMQIVSAFDWHSEGMGTFEADELGRMFAGMTGLTFFIQNLFLTLLLPLIYTAIFVGMFRLTSGGRYPLCLTYRQFWKIGIYAGFPALLVASAFPALDLPLFTFSTVFMIGLLIYWLYAVSKIDRALAEIQQEIIDEQ